jgi:hypothetical protein
VPIGSTKSEKILLRNPIIGGNTTGSALFWAKAGYLWLGIKTGGGDMNSGGESFSAAVWEAADKKWWALPGRRRKEVSRLSKEGRVHYDPEVAQIAYRWAVMQVQVGERNFLTKPAVAIPMALITLPFGGGTAGMTILYWKRVRFARRVVAVTEKNRDGELRGHE